MWSEGRRLWAGVRRAVAGPAWRRLRTGTLLIAAALMSGCSSTWTPDAGARYSPRVVSHGEPVPRGGGRYKLGRLYQVIGRTYVPRHEPSYSRTGFASWYGDDFHGRLTATGEVFDMNRLRPRIRRCRCPRSSS